VEHEKGWSGQERGLKNLKNWEAQGIKRKCKNIFWNDKKKLARNQKMFGVHGTSGAKNWTQNLLPRKGNKEGELRKSQT